jgi:sulfur-carrier protein
MMQVSFNIPGPLRGFTENRSAVQLAVNEGADVLKSLQELFGAYPGLRDRILTESGEIRQHVNIFVGNENVRYTGGLTTPLPVGVEVSIVPAITGG